MITGKLKSQSKKISSIAKRRVIETSTKAIASCTHLSFEQSLTIQVNLTSHIRQRSNKQILIELKLTSKNYRTKQQIPNRKTAT